MDVKTDENANAACVQRKLAFLQLDATSRRVLALMFIAIAVQGFYVYMPIFTLDVPEYRCRGNETEISMTESNFSERVNNIASLRNKECYKADSQDAANDTGRFKCDTDWVYKTGGGQTIVSEFDLICDDAWKRPLFTSILLLAMIFGSMIGGVMSDKFGRRPVARISYVVSSACVLCASFLPFYETLLILQFVIGFFFVIAFYTGYVLVQELVPETKRGLAALFFNTFHSSGYLLLPLVAYFVTSWRSLVRIVGVTSVAYAPLFVWLVPESPKWTNQSFSDHQRTSVEDKLMGDKDVEEQNASKPIVASVLCSNPVLRKRIVISCFLWNVSFMSHYTLSLNTSNLGGNKYINAVVSAMVDITSYFTMLIMLRKFGRRTSSVICFSLSGVFCLLTPLLREVHVTAGIVSSMTGKLFVATSSVVVTLFVGEMFPTLLRNTSIGISSMSSRLASAMAPFLIFAGKMVNLSIPFYVLGVLAMFGAALVLLLPETSNTELPNTVQEAVDLDKGRACSILRTECRVS